MTTPTSTPPVEGRHEPVVGRDHDYVAVRCSDGSHYIDRIVPCIQSGPLTHGMLEMSGTFDRSTGQIVSRRNCYVVHCCSIYEQMLSWVRSAEASNHSEQRPLSREEAQ